MFSRFDYDELPTKRGNRGSPLYRSSESTVHSDSGKLLRWRRSFWLRYSTLEKQKLESKEIIRKEESRDHHEHKYRV